MKKAYVILCIISFLIPIFFTGCDGFTPLMPEEEYDEENTVLEYLKVLPSSVEMSVNQSKKFEVEAYNSDNNLIAIDLTKVKWVASYECIACGAVWKLFPAEKSLQTTFTPLETGNYEVWAKYEGTEIRWAKAEVEVN
jgi:hypothetical protein